MSPSEVELLLLDVDTDELDTRVLLPEYRQDRADATANVEQTRSWLELGAVGSHPSARADQRISS